MIYAFLGAFLSGLALGSYTLYEIKQGEVMACEMAITTGNQAAELAHAVATRKVAEAEHQAELSNQQLQASYEQNIATVNTYFDRLRESKRAASHSNPVSSCESAGLPETATTEFAETAYKIEAWAQGCFEFVAKNCEIRE